MAPLVFNIRCYYVHTFVHKGSKSAEILTFLVLFLNPLCLFCNHTNQPQNEMNDIDTVIHLVSQWFYCD